jgi:hypothetical protein
VITITFTREEVLAISRAAYHCGVAAPTVDKLLNAIIEDNQTGKNSGDRRQETGDRSRELAPPGAGFGFGHSVF